MLECQDRRWHQYGCLFAVHYRLERRSHRNLCFAEAHIATNKPVHGRGIFHVFFDIGGGFALIRCVLINKAGFQFRLHIIIRGKGKPTLCLALRIEFYQVKSNFLDFGFGLFFQLIPGVTSQFVGLGLSSFFARIFRDLMQGVDIDI